MSLEEYNSMEETIHLLGSKENRQRLELAVENIRTKNGLLKKSLIEE
jgi:PHD/YefM family antitoxin component YafN of YafNO toxin-antitoxin module